MGVTAHWISTDAGVWSLEKEVIAFKGLTGRHDGQNLGAHLLACLRRVKIVTGSTNKVCYFLSTICILLNRLWEALRYYS
jgi:hypothetical protein